MCTFQDAPYSTELFRELQSMHAALLARSTTTQHHEASPPSPEIVIQNASKLIQSMKPTRASLITVKDARGVTIGEGVDSKEVTAAPGRRSKEILAYFRAVVRKQLALMKQ